MGQGGLEPPNGCWNCVYLPNLTLDKLKFLRTAAFTSLATPPCAFTLQKLSRFAKSFLPLGVVQYPSILRSRHYVTFVERAGVEPAASRREQLIKRTKFSAS